MPVPSSDPVPVPVSDSPAPVERKIILLAYHESAGPRPRWVYTVVGVYLLLLLMLLALPAWVNWMFEPNRDQLAMLATCTIALLICGLSLMVIPVRVIQRRRVTRRSVWIPIIASGLFAGALVLGGGLAMHEYLYGEREAVGWTILIASLMTWGAWSAIFVLIAFSGREQSVGMTLHRWLIAGSVLELLIAVPTHIVVRRRPECCAGILTGFGICVGVAVMIVSFGPSVLLLYYRRRKQITPKRKPHIK